jgi:D-alanyl-D-alanine carboxypeptidase
MPDHQTRRSAQLPPLIGALAAVTLGAVVLLLALTWPWRDPAGTARPDLPTATFDPRATASAADQSGLLPTAVPSAVAEDAVLPPSTPAETRPPPPRPPTDLLLLVGKEGEPLPEDYVPPDLVALPPGFSSPPGLPLRQEAAEAFMTMATAAREQGLIIAVVSGYRSHALQAQLYESSVQRIGKTATDRQLALPGRSEHQLGTTADISTPALRYGLDESFAALPEGRWLRAHAWEYGFVLSYPEGTEEITGYRYEPWHYRYVGIPAAEYITHSGRTSTEVLAEHPLTRDGDVWP